jgi:hypothetical protein
MQRRTSTEHRRRSETEANKYLHAGTREIVHKIGSFDGTFTDNQTLSEVELHKIKTSFEMIENLWRDISMGSQYVLASVLASIHENLGEIGSELFKKHFLHGLNSSTVSHYITLIFLNCIKLCSGKFMRFLGRSTFESTDIYSFVQISKNDYWAHWMKFLSEETFSNSMPHLGTTAAVNQSGEGTNHQMDGPDLEQTVSEQIGWIERFLANYAPSRRLKHHFFDDHVMVVILPNPEDPLGPTIPCRIISSISLRA